MQMLSVVGCGVRGLVLVPHAKDIPATSSVVTVVVAHLMVQFVMGILPKNVTTWAAFGIMVNVHMDRVKQFLLGSEWQEQTRQDFELDINEIYEFLNAHNQAVELLG